MLISIRLAVCVFKDTHLEPDHKLSLTYATARHCCGRVLMAMGDPDKAREQLENVALSAISSTSVSNHVLQLQGPL